MAIISTIVGGGIVSLPHSIYFTGFIFGFLLMVLSGIQTTYSVLLYLKAKDYLPGEPQSIFEMGYILFGRQSIFWISGILIFNSIGLMLIYFMVFSDTLKSLIIDLTSITSDDFFGK